MLTHSKLNTNFSVSNTISIIYTNTAPKITFIRGYVAFNKSISQNDKLHFHIVYNISGNVGTASDSNMIFDLDLMPRETVSYGFPYPVILNSTNDTIQAISDNSGINLILLGDVIE